MAGVTQTSWSNRHGIPYAVVDVFTNEKFKGNQLAVVRQQHHDLSQDQKQAIAKEFDYSETTFVRAGPPQEGNSWYLSIFTTTQELPFAGHPVIGTAVHLLEGLAYNGETVKGAFLTRAGKIELQYDGTTRTAKAAIPHDLHIHSTACSKDEVQRLQPSVGRFPASSPVVSIVKGLTFVLVELDSLDSLQFVNTTAHHVNVTLDKEWDDSFTVTYFYYRLPHVDKAGIVRLRTRMIEGSLEDAATGSAACTLASYLSLTEGDSDKTIRYEICQGVEMGRKSDIFVDVKLTEGKKIETVHLSGGAVQTMEGKFLLD